MKKIVPDESTRPAYVVVDDIERSSTIFVPALNGEVPRDVAEKVIGKHLGELANVNVVELDQLTEFSASYLGKLAVRLGEPVDVTSPAFLWSEAYPDSDHIRLGAGAREAEKIATQESVTT